MAIEEELPSRRRIILDRTQTASLRLVTIIDYSRFMA